MNFLFIFLLQETYDYRHSELLLYQNEILIESGNLERALNHLKKFESQIVDKLSVKETMGDLYIKLEQFSSAVPIYEQLINRNPENTMYYEKYFEARQIKDNDEKLAIYRKFQVLSFSY